MVIGILSILMGILLPAVGNARRKARKIRGMNNQRQIVAAVNFFAMDNKDKYPPSIATVGFAGIWNWSDPRKLVGKHKRTPAGHRAISEYLGSYIEEGGLMFCPSAPRQYKWLHEAWAAGDEWDNPDTAIPRDPVGGTYCFWWNYVGYLGPGRVFVGPRCSAARRRESKLLVSDFCGYGQYQDRGAFGSCERFKGAGVTSETWLMSAYWSCASGIDTPKPEVTLSAGYTDGHVGTFSVSETAALRVSKIYDGQTPYPDPPFGPGVFYLPRDGVR